LLIEFARTIVECVIKLASFGLFDPKIGSPLIDNSCSGGGAGDDDGNVNIYFMDMFTRLWLSRPSATIRPAGPEPQSASAAAAQVILHKHKNKQQQRKGEGEEEANGTEAVSYSVY
jgi:hypothetical protein